jgi:hypothetical protein
MQQETPAQRDNTMTMRSARFSLMVIWILLFVFYVGVLIFLPMIRREIDSQETKDAIWKTAYILLPIISAFASFFLGPEFAGEKKDTKRIDWQQFATLFILTAVGHLLVICYFMVYVVLVDYSFSDSPRDSFAGCVFDWYRWLATVSTLAVAPVGFVLKRADITSLTTFGQGIPTEVEPKKQRGKKPSNALSPGTPAERPPADS